MKSNVWVDRIDDIKKVFGANLTDAEFEFLKGLGLATGLDPFRKEIWSVKYGNSPAQVFIGRDGYRIIALKHPDYDYHQCDCVYDNDSFEINNGEVHHRYSLKDRGKLMGAYCITKRKSASKAVYHFVKFSEYNTGKSLWVSKPETMIKKVVEATALRAAFQDDLGGTYIPEEMPEEMTIAPEPYAMGDQIMQIESLSTKHNDRIAKALQHYKVQSIEMLKQREAQILIDRLTQLEQQEMEKYHVDEMS